VLQSAESEEQEGRWSMLAIATTLTLTLLTIILYDEVIFLRNPCTGILVLRIMIRRVDNIISLITILQ